MIRFCLGGSKHREEATSSPSARHRRDGCFVR